MRRDHAARRCERPGDDNDSTGAANRQLNGALHTIALAQAWHHPPAQAYIARKRTEGKTGREAVRALKRQLARTVFRLLQVGAGSARLAA
ncbi:MAG: hypothetical protein H0V73_09660 [Chloroflexi bacterium]|nr:hypothetical protein [Chloroflexota bacterium]